jgi:hypothetical protein
MSTMNLFKPKQSPELAGLDDDTLIGLHLHAVRRLAERQLNGIGHKPGCRCHWCQNYTTLIWMANTQDAILTGEMEFPAFAELLSIKKKIDRTMRARGR